MTDDVDLLRLIDETAAAGSKLVLVGDPRQLGAVGPGARGWDFSKIVSSYSADQISNLRRGLNDQLYTMNPRLARDKLVSIVQIEQWALLQTIAEMRAILTSAGIYDLSALGPFMVRGPQVIRPGYHFSMPFRRISALSDASLAHAIVAQGGAFSKVTATHVTDYGIHIVPNPVTDAVILGSLVQFVENGQLVIGKNVTSLIIVTDQVDRDVINRISYEDAGRAPPAPAPFPSRAAPGGSLPTANDPTAYTPDGTSDNGRDGMNGGNGMSGASGFTGEAAPSLKLYVKTTPNGLPDIDLTGHPGGRGQDGQDGGTGEDGAKGREFVGQCLGVLRLRGGARGPRRQRRQRRERWRRWDGRCGREHEPLLPSRELRLDHGTRWFLHRRVWRARRRWGWRWCRRLPRTRRRSRSRHGRVRCASGMARSGWRFRCARGSGPNGPTGPQRPILVRTDHHRSVECGLSLSILVAARASSRASWN